MKRIALVILSVIMAMPIMAQRYESNDYGNSRRNFFSDGSVYYGLRLGLTISTVSSDDSRLDGGSAQTGLNLGGVIGFQLSSSTPLYLETGLSYTEKGGKGDVEGNKFTYSLNYLELPIVAKYKYVFEDIDDRFSIQPFVGGYLAMGIEGKVRDFGKTKEDRKTYSSFSDDFFQRFDGGLRFGCGVEYSMMYLEQAYDFGLANICHIDFDSSRNSCFYINLGVNF